MDKNLQDLLTTMTDVMKGQQEAIQMQQAEIEKLKTGGSGTPDPLKDDEVSSLMKDYIADRNKKAKPASDEELTKAMENFRF